MESRRDAVADTGLLVAVIRARETTREDRLFTDPFADKLAGDTGHRVLDAALATSGDRTTMQIVVRTKFWDDALLEAASCCRQVVLVAAGMDARAYRLDWPADTTVFELDQAAVIAAKNALLAGDTPQCTRVPIGVDLADDWPAVLTAAGFSDDAPAVWLTEGLLQYLDEAAVLRLFERIDALSAPGSVLCYDVVGKSLLQAPFMAELLKSMADNGAPWLFGTDDPAELVRDRGWSAEVTDIAEPGNRWNRWYAPVSTGDAPRGYFAIATKA
ncbi:methyltransferase (TIGR00027 family) [Mycolicibacterium sp. BK556]|uniref:SAM-dependent methyltransferase n=1 Tax=unclassified Mycolicibacterium TaxID=2636767 RepID=UPI00160EF880|nr:MULTISPECIES: SAM-dependent methyltransferase [unclassified Mycolicibacterium]MBB3601760.1 methyltransferase (TIGR00027 family) [Mycolicibacterium sp. BK556]MBB3631512.1 methyltransferase (TIGR00027 family) [Mycolicibacterium sp. BK607]